MNTDSGRVVSIIQARMGSTRLPGKVLADIAGRPMLSRVIERMQIVRCVDAIVVATSTNREDDAIEEWCAQNRVACFRGSAEDVLDRYYNAALAFEASVIVRVTADCPLIDPCLVDQVVETYAKGGHDYVSNNLRYTFPDGLDTEVCSFAALETAWREANLPAEREHVTPYIRTCGKFCLGGVENEPDLSSRNLRWTVDEPADLDFVRAVYSRLPEDGKRLGWREVLKLVDKEPHLLRMNGRVIQNEGYYKSLAAEPPLPACKRSIEQSLALKRKAAGLIPSGTQTFSKGPNQFVQGVAPVFLERGEGCRVRDVDGNEYIDYIGGLGPVLLGYAHPAVNEAVMEQLHKGVIFSLPHPLEIELAELLCGLIPCAEMVRYGKNGSDVTSGAVRLARAYTERDKIACCGYHGWQDWYVGTTTRSGGVPKAVADLTLPFQYNDIDSLRRIFAENPQQVAAVIMEPVSVMEPRDGFLQRVADLTRGEGALLIFDEIVTGFRWSIGGAQEYFEVTPDLACFGKAMGNGFPISAVVGRSNVMQMFDEIFFSFTFGGEAASMAAAVATIRTVRESKVISFIWSQGRKLSDGYNTLAREFGLLGYTECIGYPCRTVITFKDQEDQESLLLKSLFQQEVLKRGILSCGYHNVSFAHKNSEIDQTLRVYRTALETLSKAIESGNPAQYLEGEPVRPVFRRI